MIAPASVVEHAPASRVCRRPGYIRAVDVHAGDADRIATHAGQALSRGATVEPAEEAGTETETETTHIRQRGQDRFPGQHRCPSIPRFCAAPALLQGMAPRQAGHLALTFVLNRITMSTTRDQLLHPRSGIDPRSRAAIRPVRDVIARCGGGVNRLTFDGVVAVTQMALDQKAANCGEMALIAGRWLASHGWPHSSVIACIGEDDDDRQTDHALLRLSGAPNADGSPPEAFFIDPFAAMLPRTTQLALFGAAYGETPDAHPSARLSGSSSDGDPAHGAVQHPAAFDMDGARTQWHVYLTDRHDHAAFVPLAQAPATRLNVLASFYAAPDGRIHYRRVEQRLRWGRIANKPLMCSSAGVVAAHQAPVTSRWRRVAQAARHWTNRLRRAFSTRPEDR